MKISILLAAVATALPTIPALALPMTPAEYVATAGASDLYERTASQIVLTSTSNPKVRSFADMMLSAHSDSSAVVKAAAGKSGTNAASPKLTPTQEEMIAQLKVENGPARDAVYVAQQKAAHGQALSVQKAYSMEGDAAPLKAAAGKIVPVVEHHIMMLMDM